MKKLPQINQTFTSIYELDARSRDLNSDFTLKDCWFGSVKLVENVGLDKYVYSGYGIRVHKFDYLMET